MLRMGLLRAANTALGQARNCEEKLGWTSTILMIGESIGNERRLFGTAHYSRSDTIHEMQDSLKNRSSNARGKVRSLTLGRAVQACAEFMLGCFDGNT